MNAEHRQVFIESLTADEARMFATYVAGLAPRSFAVAASLVERDRVAFAPGPARLARPLAPALPAVPRGLTPLYDWAAEGDFPPADEREPGRDGTLDEPLVDDQPGDDGAAGYVPEALPDDLAQQAASRFLADLMTGDVPGVRRIKTELNIGQDKAQQVRTYLSGLASA